MPNLPRSSIDCLPCRIEWRPSRLGALFAGGLVTLASFALLESRLLESASPPLQGMLVALAAAAAFLTYRRERAAAPGVLELLPGRRARWHPEGGAIPSGGIDVAATLHEQWPLLVVRLGAGGHTLRFWPDTLCDSGRRALRRWAGAAPEASPITQFWTG